MGDNLAQLLYTAFRAAAADPSALPVWGNVPSTERETWEVVALEARKTMAQRFVVSIDNHIQGAMRVAELRVLRESWSR